MSKLKPLGTSPCILICFICLVWTETLVWFLVAGIKAANGNSKDETDRRVSVCPWNLLRTNFCQEWLRAFDPALGQMFEVEDISRSLLLYFIYFPLMGRKVWLPNFPAASSLCLNSEGVNWLALGWAIVYIKKAVTKLLVISVWEGDALLK